MNLTEGREGKAAKQDRIMGGRIMGRGAEREGLNRSKLRKQRLQRSGWGVAGSRTIPPCGMALLTERFAIKFFLSYDSARHDSVCSLRHLRFLLLNLFSLH
jgi:hypothetical protein